MKIMKKLEILICCTILVILNVLQVSSSVLRNPITDRCVHLGSVNGELRAYANPCTFSDQRTGVIGNRDQWLDITPASREEGGTPGHKIVKHLRNGAVCLTSQKENDDRDDGDISNNNEVGTIGDCNSPNAVVLIHKLITPVRGQEGGRRSRFRGQIFSIENQKSGKCLTVYPGTPELHMTNCSRENSLQRWIVCRHLDLCDVEITWSPTNIIFPKDPFNSSSDFQDFMVGSSSSQSDTEIPQVTNAPTRKPTIPSTTTFNVLPETEKDSGIPLSPAPKILLDETLYFTYNAMKILKMDEDLLTSIISKFYTAEELDKALGILTQNFILDLDPRSTLNNKGMQIVYWMKHIVNHGLDKNVIFASRKIDRVPPVFTTSNNNNSPKPNKMKEIIQSIKGRIEATLNKEMESLEKLKTKLIGEIDRMLKEEEQREKGIEGRGRQEPPIITSTESDNDFDLLGNVDLRMGMKPRSRKS